MSFQPILFLFLWSAALRITISDALPPIQFEVLLDPHGVQIWTITALICPPLAMLAWWLVTHCRLSRASLAGLWLRLGADLGQFAVVLTYHLVGVMTFSRQAREDVLYSRYIIAAVVVFLAAILVRDIRALAMVERIAKGIRGDDR